MKLNSILENPFQPDYSMTLCFGFYMLFFFFFPFSSMEIQCHQITLQPVNTKSAVGISRARGGLKEVS